jgi:peptidyl-prolyl cis-trans isomerase C
VTLNDLMKKNQLTQQKMRDEIRFGLKINKLVVSQMGKKTKPTDKEITKFYQTNKDKFQVPESVHVRHILVAKAPGDDEKITAAKKAKAEDLRKQLLAGANFADLAAKNSDCPSKASGGDLGTFARGQMIKPFEAAAFSQEINAIGPVVETEYGYHILQVLERNGAKTMSLDKKMKEMVAAFLQQQKQQEAFEAVLAKLKKKANIVVYAK